MSISIYLPESDIDGLLEFYSNKLKLLKEEKNKLDKEESSIRATIAQLKSKKNSTISVVDTMDIYITIPNESQYYSKWTWSKKIDFAIRESGKPLTTAEIVDAIVVFEPFYEGENRRKAIKSISSILSTKAGMLEETDKEFIKIDDNTGRSKFFVRVTEHLPSSVSDEMTDMIKHTEIEPEEDNDEPF